jgi:dynein light chain LC8-type
MAEKQDTTTSSVDIGQPPKDPSLTGTSPKAIIKNVDMSEEMQQDSVDIASAALEKYNIEKDIAAQIKKEFDRRHGPTWHVVVGKNFGSYVTHGTLPDFFRSGPLYTPVLRRVFLCPLYTSA